MSIFSRMLPLICDFVVFRWALNTKLELPMSQGLVDDEDD